MSLRTSYLKSLVAFSAGTFLHSFISFLTTPLITFLVSPRDFGKVGMFNVVYSILTFVVRLGGEHAFARFYYELEPSQRSELLWTCLFSSLFAIGLVSVPLSLMWGPVSMLVSGAKDPLVVVLLLGTLVAGIFQLYALQSVRMRNLGWVYSFLQLVNSASRVAGIVLMTKFLGKNSHAVLTGNLLALVVSFAVGLLLDFDAWSPVKFNISLLRKVLAYGIPYTPASLSIWFFRNVDKLVLRSLGSFDSLGLYSVAQKLAGALTLLQGAFSAFWVPTAYKHQFEDGGDRRLFSTATNAVAAVMFALASISVSLKDVLFLLVSRTYTKASEVAPFLVFVPVFATLSETTTLGISFSGKTYWHSVIALVAGALNFVLSLLLVPLLGAKGAALSIGLTYFFVFTLRTYVSSRLFAVDYDLKRISLCTAFLSLQCAVSSFINGTTLQVVTGTIALLAVLTLYRYEVRKVFVETASEILERVRKSGA